jgi:hypothetical protein
MIFGADRLIADLAALGYRVERVLAAGGVIFAVVREYEILVGVFGGRVIDLGLQGTPDFPRSVHSSVHIRAQPQLHEIGSVPNVRNVTTSVLGPEWRYWSTNFGWNGAERTARRLMSQVNTVFEHA